MNPSTSSASVSRTVWSSLAPWDDMCPISSLVCAIPARCLPLFPKTPCVMICVRISLFAGSLAAIIPLLVHQLCLAPILAFAFHMAFTLAAKKQHPSGRWQGSRSRNSCNRRGRCIIIYCITAKGDDDHGTPNRTQAESHRCHLRHLGIPARSGGSDICRIHRSRPHKRLHRNRYPRNRKIPCVSRHSPIKKARNESKWLSLRTQPLFRI